MKQKFSQIKNKYLSQHKFNTGITLIELMVVLAIFAIIMGISLYDYGSFKSHVSIQNLADDIGLSVRRAQSYSIGVHNSLSSFANGYGIHFATEPGSVPLAGSNKSFIIFSDIATGQAGNKLYDYNPRNDSTLCDATTLGQGSECIDFLNITTNDEVIGLCPNSDSGNCIKGYADIVFQRPDPDAHICVFNTNKGTFESSAAGGPGPIKSADPVNPGVGGGEAPADGAGGIGPADTGGLECYNLCLAKGGSSNDCSASCGYTPPVDGGGGATDACPALNSVDVIVHNILSGETKTITVTNIGQISIK